MHSALKRGGNGTGDHRDKAGRTTGSARVEEEPGVFTVNEDSPECQTKHPG